MKQLPLGLKLLQDLQSVHIGKLQIQGGQIKTGGANSMQEPPARGEHFGGSPKGLKEAAEVTALLRAVFDDGDLHCDGQKTNTIISCFGFFSCKRFLL